MDPAAKQAAKYKTQSLLGIMQDKMEVGMAKIRGEESAVLDVAIIKATLQDEVVPKEKHVRTLKIACGATSPRQTANYVIHGLAKRLEENPKAWLVTLKTLIVFHRIMRETDPTFQEELLRYAERTGHHRLLRLESFADHTTKETWDYSAWIRVYSLYLDERLAVFRSMKFDPEQDSQGLQATTGDTLREPLPTLRDSRLKTCAAAELLEHLPSVQRLLGRLVSCVPEGAAQANEIALLACSLVLKEIRAVYKVVCEGVLNLVDRIFEMDRGDALKGLELVKENLAVNDKLNTFMGAIGNIPPLRGAVQFPQLQPLPADFLTTLEDYIKDAPKGSADVAKTSVSRTSTATTNARGGTKLVVGGPVKDTSSGPTSPQTAAPPPPSAPAPAPEVDLLGGFESFQISAGPPAAPPGAAAAAAAGAAAPGQPGAPFDPFASFTNVAAAAPAAAPPPPPQPEMAVAAAPAVAPPPYAYGQASSFANPATAAAAAGGPPPYGFPGIPAPQVPAPAPIPPPPAAGAPPAAGGTFGDNMFGGGANAFGGAPAAAPAAFPLPQQPEIPAVPAQPFNPFANPSMHATVAPHMPGAAPVPQPAPATPIPAAPPAVPAAPSPLNAFAPPAAPVPGFPQPPYPGAPAPQTPGAPQPVPVYGGAAAPGILPPQQQPPAPAGFANPFGSPGGPAPAPANPFASPGPSPTNPFGGPTGAAPGAGAPPSNPFGGPTGGGGWPGAPAVPTVVTQQVGGYNLKKPADPLMDLSLDLFGKPQGPPPQQPMRQAPAGATAPQNGAGSPF